MTPAVTVATWVWLALELALLVRDRRRGVGETARDRGTRRLTFVATVAAVLLAEGVAIVLRVDAGLRGWADLGPLPLVVIVAGLALRLWAIAVLGGSFRTTVEVDAGQAVVSRGPYRRIRHPSYTGILVICAGIGLGLGNWISLALLLVVPATALARRIAVEETELVRVMGPAYEAYRARTKRLIPYLW